VYQTRNRSPYLWVVTLVVVMAILFDVRLGRVGPIRLELLINLCLASGMILVAWTTRRGSPVLTLKRMGLFGVAYILTLFLSFTWSVSMTETIFQAGIFTLLLLFFMSMRYPVEEEMLVHVFKLLGYLALISWLFYAVAGDIALSPKEVAWRLRGILGHEQRLAIYMAYALIILTCLRINNVEVPNWRFWAFLMMVTLLATQARAFTAFTVLIIAALLFTRVAWVRYLSIALSFPVIFLAITALPDFLQFFSRGDADFTLTGRTSIWAFALTRWQDSQLLGYGYGAFGDFITTNLVFDSYVPPHAHNAIIHSLFETGLVGTALLLAWMGSLVMIRSRLTPAPHRWIVLMAFFAGLTGVVFGEKMSGALALLLMFASAAWSASYNSARQGRGGLYAGGRASWPSELGSDKRCPAQAGRARAGAAQFGPPPVDRPWKKHIEPE
jgi:O-antigen ligase